MLRLLERNIGSVDGRLVLLAPPGISNTASSQLSRNLVADPHRHQRLLKEIQRLRGGIYYKDGALHANQLTVDGRHEAPEDLKSWHLMALNDRGVPTGCIWYLQYPDMPRFEHLRLRNAAIASTEDWGSKVRAAVACDIERARRERVHYAEVGGWAVAQDSRLTDCLMLVLGIYGLSQMCGGAFVAATATVRHASAAILRRLGGGPLQGAGHIVPPYFDKNYDCEMEILRFDTRAPGARFIRLVEVLKEKLLELPVIAAGDVAIRNAA